MPRYTTICAVELKPLLAKAAVENPSCLANAAAALSSVWDEEWGIVLEALLSRAGAFMRLPIGLGAMLSIVMSGAVLSAPTENIKIASTFWGLVSAGDVAGAMAYVDPQAEFRSGEDIYSGSVEIKTVIESYATAGYQFHMTHFKDDGAGRIAYWYEVYDKAGTAAVSYGDDGLTIVRAGHIVFDGTSRTVPKRFSSP